MKFSELEKGTVVYSGIVGRCKVIKVNKKYIRMEQLDFGNIVCRLFYSSPELDIQERGISLKNPKDEE